MQQQLVGIGKGTDAGTGAGTEAATGARTGAAVAEVGEDVNVVLQLEVESRQRK